MVSASNRVQKLPKPYAQVQEARATAALRHVCCIGIMTLQQDSSTAIEGSKVQQSAIRHGIDSANAAALPIACQLLQFPLATLHNQVPVTNHQ